jgi:hypothetical protein
MRSVAAVACVALLAGGGAAEAKKGKKAATAEVESFAIASAPGPDLTAFSFPTFEVGKAFKGRAVGKVELTTQVIGSVNGYYNELGFRLISPQGRAVSIGSPFFNNPPQASYGPLKLTPNSDQFTCSSLGECAMTGALGPPFVGTVGDSGLNFFYGTRMRGTWTLEILNLSEVGTGTLNAELRVTPARPIE